MKKYADIQLLRIEIYIQVVDYAPKEKGKLRIKLPEVNYEQLKSGQIKIGSRVIPTASLSSYVKAKEIALELKSWIKKGKFYLSEPVESIATVGSDKRIKSLNERKGKL